MATSTKNSTEELENPVEAFFQKIEKIDQEQKMREEDGDEEEEGGRRRGRNSEDNSIWIIGVPGREI